MKMFSNCDMGSFKNKTYTVKLEFVIVTPVINQPKMCENRFDKRSEMCFG